MGILPIWKKIVTVVKIFEILKSVHEGARAHTGYHKIYKDIEQTYYGIPRKACMEFIKGCVQCACKKPQRNVALLKPITSKYVMHRGQLDLVDKRADPDGGQLDLVDKRADPDGDYSTVGSVITLTTTQN
jgi:hypothetical protein